MRPTRALLLTSLLCLAWAWPAVAAQPQRPWEGGPVHFFAGPEIGAFIPADGAIRGFYNSGNLFLGLRAGLLVEPQTLEVWPDYKLDGTLSLFVSGGYWRDEGRETLTPQPKLTLYLVPTSVGLEYAFRFREEQPLAPFVGAGFDTVYFREEVAIAPKQVIQGVRFGWHAEAGLRLLLDWVDPAAAVNFREHVGVRNTWVGFRGRYQNVAGFDEGIDLSGYTFDLSLIFEF